MALLDVVEEMKRDYKFVATDRQYKRRISEWHLDKNVKDEEMRTIIAVDAMRLRQGKKSTFHVRGRLVDRKKIDRFVQRKRIDRSTLEAFPGMQDFTSACHFSASDCMSLLPENVRCSTPPDDRPPIIYVSEDLGRGTSNRGLIHGNTLGTKGVKRVRGLGIKVGNVGVSLDSGRNHEHQKGSSPIRKRPRNSHDTSLHAQAKNAPNRSALLGESKHDDDISVTGTRVTASGVSAQRPLTHSEDTMASKISRSDWNPQGTFWQFLCYLTRYNMLTALIGSAMKHSKHRVRSVRPGQYLQRLSPRYFVTRSPPRLALNVLLVGFLTSKCITRVIGSRTKPNNWS